MARPPTSHDRPIEAYFRGGDWISYNHNINYYFVVAEKGGVGKSVMSRLWSQYFFDKNFSYLGLDADQSHATLIRYYPDFTQALDLDTFERTNRIMELALETDRQFLIDFYDKINFFDNWIRETASQ